MKFNKKERSIKGLLKYSERKEFKDKNTYDQKKRAKYCKLS